MKIIKIRYDNGAIYGFPAEILADLRAKYYAEHDKDTTYQEEYDYTLSSFSECYNWLRNEVPYELLSQHLFEVSPPSTFDAIAAMDDDETEYGMVDYLNERK